MRRGLVWLIGVVAVAMLPLASFAPPAVAVDPVGALCTVSSSGALVCPAVPAPPGLINSGALAATTPVIAASLLRLEEQAVDNTIADHRLAASDRDAVKSWARTEAQAELWALIVEAVNTPEADRTVDQQHAAQWMADLTRGQMEQAARHAGAEYATWAGLDVDEYWRLADAGASKDQLQSFLASAVEPFSTPVTDRGGYCRYEPPAPYTSEYDGSTAQTCVEPCPNPLGCAVPTPTYDQFVKWGQAAATYPTLSDPSFQVQAAAIAAGAAFGSAVVAAAVIGFTISVTMGSVLTGSALLAAVLPFMYVAGVVTEVEAVAGAIAAEEVIGGTAAASALGAAVAVIILAITIAVLEGIRVADNAALPGKVAELVVNARTATPDPATLIATTEGASTMFGLFVGATLPRPRNDTACDNSLIPPWAYTSSFDPNLLIYVPLGGNEVLTSPVDRKGCLNPPEIPPATVTDPQFVVTPRVPVPGQPPEVVSPTITVANSAVDGTRTVRVSGDWFVQQVNLPGRAPVTAQSLRLNYTDWDGEQQVAWLLRDASGRYRFFGVSVPPDATTTSIDPSTCRAEGTCWSDETIRYVGADGLDYSASVQPYQAPVGTPSYAPTTPEVAAPVTFAANTFAPPGATSVLRYEWRFQKAGCGWSVGCFHPTGDPNNPTAPSYTDPVTGASASYTWQTSGTFKVELTATDQHGENPVTTTFDVRVADLPPEVVLAPDCAAGSAAGCDARSGAAGSPVTVHGTVDHAGALDNEVVQVNWGDGSPREWANAGPNTIILVGGGATTELTVTNDTSMSLVARHTYAVPGIYYGTVSAQDGGGGSDFATFKETVSGPQAIDFPAIADHGYGEQVTVAATGGGSGKPVTFAAGPAGVCTAGGEHGATLTLVGVGECTVTASQAANPPVFAAAPDVPRTFQVTPAALRITAEDRTKVYGADDPAYTASFAGLVNGDTEADITGLSLTGPPTGSDVGEYAIVASGATNPNYDIDLVDGTLTITPADLRITAEDQTKVYGAPDPPYTASFDGLVNGDTEVSIRGLQLTGPPTGAGVGDYPIVASGATDPNYAIEFVDGTETITPAALKITADDKTVPSRKVAAYTWKGSGWVNGDTDDSLGSGPSSAPSCGARVNGTVVSGTTPPGGYPGTITCQGASDPNYTITYASGKLTINPLITLDQQGLPSTVPHQATVDGSTLALPVKTLEVAYGTSHRYRFPPVVAAPSGDLYLTRATGFEGEVTTNTRVVAGYRTMAQVVAAALASGRIKSAAAAAALMKRWHKVEHDIESGKLVRARDDLHDVAAFLRSGKKIGAATVQTLLAYTQIVYVSVGGTATV